MYSKYEIAKESKIRKNSYADKSINYIKKQKINSWWSFTFSKRPENILPKLWPTYFIKTNGVYVWDLNKRNMKTFFSVGQNILGYNNKYVDRVV